MSKIEKSYEQVELKYCERCGGLFLRPQGSARAYCAPCVPLMADLPTPQPKKIRDAKLPVAHPEFEIEGSLLELWAVVEVNS